MKGGVSFMIQMHGNATAQPATVMRPRASAGVRRNRLPSNSTQVMTHSPGPTMKKQQSRNDPRKRNLMNTQRPKKKPDRKFSQVMLPPPVTPMNR